MVHGSSGASTSALVELVDVFPTLLDLAGLLNVAAIPDVRELEGISLTPVLENPSIHLPASKPGNGGGGRSSSSTISSSSSSSALPSSSSWRNASFSQYPKCMNSTMEFKPPYMGNEDPCTATPSNQFTHMGYTMRTNTWRYTEWPRWICTEVDVCNDPVDWGHVDGVELYTHAGDDGSSFDAFENENLAYTPEYAAVVAELSAALRLGWRSAIPSHLFPPPMQLATDDPRLPTAHAHAHAHTHAQQQQQQQQHNISDGGMLYPACSTDLGCSLNGVCTAGGDCACDTPWTGPSCGVLAFKPSKLLKTLVPTTVAKSSWGGSIIEADGEYHLYANTITSVTNISKGLIFHGTSKNVEGPYAFDADAPAVGGGEGAAVVKQEFKNGTARYVLWDSPDKRAAQFSSIRVASTPGGPFVDVPGGFASQPESTCFDAAPIWNVTEEAWYVTCQGYGAATTSRPIIIFTSKRLVGPWTMYANSSAWRPDGQWLEDPYLWRDARGHWHLLQHAFDIAETEQCLSSMVSAHAFSQDGREWHTIKPYVAPYGHIYRQQRAGSSPADEGEGDGGGKPVTRSFSTCERPKPVINADGKMTHVVFAVDSETRDGGCKDRNPCQPNGALPCSCVNCKWYDVADTIIAALEI